MQQVVVVDSHAFVAKSFERGIIHSEYFIYNHIVRVIHIKFDYSRRISGDSVEVHIGPTLYLSYFGVCGVKLSYLDSIRFDNLALILLAFQQRKGIIADKIPIKCAYHDPFIHL